MTSRINIFEENQLLGGYSLAVRDDWTFKIKRTHITKEEKKEYERKFGNKIITYNEFFDWWCKFNKLGKYSKDK